MSQTPRYRATAQSYIDDKLVEVDQEVDYNGIPGYNLEPVNEEARKRKAAAPRQTMYDPIEALPATMATNDVPVGLIPFPPSQAPGPVQTLTSTPQPQGTTATAAKVEHSAAELAELLS